MEETISLVLHGCKLAKDLEQSLQNRNVSVISPNNQQVVDMVFKSCTEISRVFGSAVERLASVVSLSELEPEPAGVNRSDPSLQEWLIRHGVTQAAMDMILQQQIILAGRPVVGSSSAALEMMVSDETVGAGVPAADSGGGSLLTASSHRVRRRKDEGKKRIIRARAPPGGNAELPPDDNYTWRKYGQKEILGSIYPRAYYRCTHQKMYNCPAKKQVQRVDTDFHTFQVTYIGDHTCHMSATAPSIPPPLQPPSETTSTHQWLSMDFNVGPSGSTAAGRSSGGAGPSTSRYGKDVDYPGVEELADAMFNSGSSSGGNSMDFIFSTVDHRWERGDKKQD